MRSRVAVFHIVALLLLLAGGQSHALASSDSTAAPALPDSVRAPAPITAAADTRPMFQDPGSSPPRTGGWPTWLIGLLSAVVGGASGAFLAHCLDVKQRAQAARRATLRDMVGSRSDVTGQPFTMALNEAIVVFGDQPKVLAAIDSMMTSPDNDKLYALYSCMAKAAGIAVVSKGAFVKAFNVAQAR